MDLKSTQTLVFDSCIHFWWILLKIWFGFTYWHSFISGSCIGFPFLFTLNKMYRLDRVKVIYYRDRLSKETGVTVSPSTCWYHDWSSPLRSHADVSEMKLKASKIFLSNFFKSATITSGVTGSCWVQLLCHGRVARVTANAISSGYTVLQKRACNLKIAWLRLLSSLRLSSWPITLLIAWSCETQRSPNPILCCVWFPFYCRLFHSLVE